MRELRGAVDVGGLPVRCPIPARLTWSCRRRRRGRWRRRIWRAEEAPSGGIATTEATVTATALVRATAAVLAAATLTATALAAAALAGTVPETEIE